jgi:hypothetical protein
MEPPNLGSIFKLAKQRIDNFAALHMNLLSKSRRWMRNCRLVKPSVRTLKAIQWGWHEGYGTELLYGTQCRIEVTAR